MNEGNPARMECVARKPVQRLSVDGVADDGPSTDGEMHANLVTPSSEWSATQERTASIGRDDFVVRDARGSVRTNDAPSAMGGIGAERQVDFAVPGLDAALNHGEILLLRRRPRSLQIRVYGAALRHDDNTRRQLVESPGR